VLTIGFFIHTIVVLQRAGVHNLGVLDVTLLCLQVVPWGDGVSIDSRLQRGRMRQRSPQEYGFAIWLPGFTIRSWA
jgi:hypothetical protein